LITLLLILSESYTDPRPFGAIGLAMALAIWVNFETVIGPSSQPQNNPSLLRTWWVSRRLQPGNVFIFSGWSDASITNVYMAYFAPQIEGHSLRGYLFAHPQGDLTDLTAVLEGARKEGKPVYAEAALWDEYELSGLEAMSQLKPGDLHSWLSRFHKQGEATGPGGYRIFRIS
jgi:hypothetical protein